MKIEATDILLLLAVAGVSFLIVRSLVAKQATAAPATPASTYSGYDGVSIGSDGLDALAGFIGPGAT